MSDLKQAAQQALEALDCVCNDERTCDVLHHGRAEFHAIGESCPAVKRLWVARRTLSEALAAPQPEPVAWLRVIDEAMVTHHLGVADPTDDYETAKRKMNNLLSHAQDIGAYFAAPPQRQPLTVAEVEQILAQHDYAIHGDRARYIVRMTEKAHGIGGAT